MLNPGTYKARAVSAALEKSAQKGTEQVNVTFRTESGETIHWIGFFTEKTQARTIESLMLCGWNGDDFATFAGVDKNDVNIVVEHEMYEGKSRARVAWVNDPNRPVGGKPMEQAEVMSFAERMRAQVAALKASKGQSEMGGTSFPFGQNAAKPQAGVKF